MQLKMKERRDRREVLSGYVALLSSKREQRWNAKSDVLKTRILGAWRGLAAKNYARRVAKDEITRRIEAERQLEVQAVEAEARE